MGGQRTGPRWAVGGTDYVNGKVQVEIRGAGSVCKGRNIYI